MASNWEFVQSQTLDARDHASTAFTEAMEFIDKIASYLPNLFRGFDADIEFRDIDSPKLDPGFDEIEKPILNLPPITPIEFPDYPPFGDGLYEVNFGRIGSPPSFNIPDPDIQPIDRPDPLNVSAPSDPPVISTDFTFPNEPVTSIPSVPTFEELNIPESPAFSFPLFDYIPPVYVGGDPPEINNDWSENPYESELLNATYNELKDRVLNGGTGLNPVVEQAIWDRARNREDINAKRSRLEVLRTEAARGFVRPSGSSLAALDTLAQETQNKVSDLSREISIKQAELEQRNIEFALQQAISLENLLIQNNNNVLNRAFDMQKQIQMLSIEIYKVQLQKFQIELETYKTYSTVFETQIRSELSKAEVYKTQVQAEALRNEINKSKVDLYNAQLNGIKTSVDVYKTTVDAVSSRIQAEALKLQNYKAEVEAYSAQVSAKRDEYSMYSESIKAELSKAQIYDSKVKAFVSRVEAYAKTADIETKLQEASINLEDLKIKNHNFKIEALVKKADVELKQISALVEKFRGDIQAYQASVSAESSRIDSVARAYESEVRLSTAEADVALKNADILLKQLSTESELILKALEAGASISSQLAAASLAGINVSSQVQTSASDNENHNINENYDYEV